MDLQQRFKIAIKEDANVLGLAGATALSLVLLNPLPLLVGLVAEVAYLLYIPDSRWYNSRLSNRHDAEILARRKSLQDKIFPTLSDTVSGNLRNLESARERLTSVTVDVPSERRWSELVRQLDYLMEVLTQLCGRQVAIPARIPAIDGVELQSFALDDAGILNVEERRDLLAHYEHETEELIRLANLQKEAERQAVLMRSVRDMERETEAIRKELFQFVVAQHLGESVWQAAVDAERFADSVPDRLRGGQETVASLYTELYQLVQGAERIARHQNDWLKQSGGAALKKA